MNRIKKVLLFIFAIEGLVLISLLTIKVWDISYENVNQNHIVTKATIATPSLIEKQNISKKKSRILEAFFKKSFTSLTKFVSHQSAFSLLYDDELYQKKIEVLEKYSKSFLGTPYVWGATGPKSFDCSGFTKKVYGKCGIKLPRHSTLQAKVGKYVKFKDLERGDLVFFDTEKKPTGIVNHVGIYLGDGKFIHASSGKKKVVIMDFNKKPFYRNRFLWGRRVVKSNTSILFSSLFKRKNRTSNITLSSIYNY